MFHSTRIKLTGWYLLIIMAISIAFSAFIYFGATQEFDRALRIQRFRLEHPEVRLHMLGTNQFAYIPVPAIAPPDPQVIEEAKFRVLEDLIGINVIILIFSALAGYFLAGRTLKPIKVMLDEQNRFITDASHELNTPLTSLRTTIEVNLRNNALTLKKAKDVLTSNLEEVQNLQALSNELITLTQYENRTENPTFENVNIASAILQAREKVQALADNKHIVISTDVSPIEVLGNQRSLITLFVILFDNAIKYSPEKTKIVVSVKSVDGKVVVLFTDQGVGIDKKNLPYIFDRFYRVDASRTKQQIPGYGLGLSIAKKIITTHNGTISVESTLKKGTTFTMYFPLYE